MSDIQGIMSFVNSLKDIYFVYSSESLNCKYFIQKEIKNSSSFYKFIDVCHPKMKELLIKSQKVKTIPFIISVSKTNQIHIYDEDRLIHLVSDIEKMLLYIKNQEQENVIEKFEPLQNLPISKGTSKLNIQSEIPVKQDREPPQEETLSEVPEIGMSSIRVQIPKGEGHSEMKMSSIPEMARREQSLQENGEILENIEEQQEQESPEERQSKTKFAASEIMRERDAIEKIPIQPIPK